MNDRTVIVLSSIVGAAIGGAAGFLLLTERGRAIAREIEPRVDELTRDIDALQRAGARAFAAAREGWRALHETAARPEWTGAQPSSQASAPRPF
jgi:hypothetical protein